MARSQSSITGAIAAAAVIVTAASVQAQSGGTDARTFMEQMARAGIAEVALGRLAVDRASDAAVKSFGQTMVDEHEAAHQELSLLAEGLNVSIPKELDDADRALAERLSSLRDRDFDRAYLDAMVQRHTEAAARLKSRAQTARSPTPVGTSGSRENEQEIGNWAARTLRAVQKHLERARELQQKVR